MADQLVLNNGVTMPAPGLGVFQSSPDDTTAAVRHHVENGVRPPRRRKGSMTERSVAAGLETRLPDCANASGGAASRVAAREFAARLPVVVLVHGAWHGSWCWSELRAELALRGLDSRAVDLPSAGIVHGAAAGLRDDVEAIGEVLNAIDGPVMLVAHSYGGVPATEAAAHANNVQHVVYVTAFRLAAGQSMRSAGYMPETDAEYLPVPERAGELLFNGLPDERVEQLVARLVPQSSRSFSDKVDWGAEAIPSASYVICDRDQILPVALQERFAAGLATDRMATGHSPYLVDPARLATVLAEAVRANPSAPSPYDERRNSLVSTMEGKR
jgi:pimeloyl-ACP methyl ester carboxylesterase